MPVAYLNGEYMPLEKANVSTEDRGFLFGDGIYEVLRFYQGRAFRVQEHLARFDHSLEGARLPRIAAVAELPEIIERVRALNDLYESDVYIEYTRGPEHPRSHPFPAAPKPTLLVMPLSLHPLDPKTFENGVVAITQPDIRWARCDIKSVMLLPNCMAKQAAREQGAFEAILVRDGFVTEGSTTNMFAVVDGVLRTHPGNERILGGISRLVTLELARDLRVPLREEAFSVTEMQRCQELFLTSTSAEVLAITQVDGHRIADGKPGPITNDLHIAFVASTAAA